MTLCACVGGCVDSLGHGRGQVFHGEGYGVMQNISACSSYVPSAGTGEVWSCDLRSGSGGSPDVSDLSSLSWSQYGCTSAGT